MASEIQQKLTLNQYFSSDTNIFAALLNNKHEYFIRVERIQADRLKFQSTFLNTFEADKQKLQFKLKYSLLLV